MLPFPTRHAVQAGEGACFTGLCLWDVTGILKPPRQGNMGQSKARIVCERRFQALLCPIVEG
jgi:hypothetical protein